MTQTQPGHKLSPVLVTETDADVFGLPRLYKGRCETHGFEVIAATDGEVAATLEFHCNPEMGPAAAGLMRDDLPQ